MGGYALDKALESLPDWGAFPVAGMILLATDLTTERDARLLLPEALRVCATRVAFDNPTTPDNLRLILPRLAQAAILLVPGAMPGSIYFSCTAATATLGEQAVREAIGQGRPGVRVITPLSAAETAFVALDCRRISIMTPYIPATAAVVARYFSRNGYDVVHTHTMGMEDDRDMARLDADTLIAAALEADHPDAGALFISCTALPVALLVPELERRLGKPVLTSNLAALWMMKHLAGFVSPQEDRGTLFKLRLVEPVS